MHGKGYSIYRCREFLKAKSAFSDGLKVYDEQGRLSEENKTGYEADTRLYAALNNVLKIPVIENEYQEYKVSPAPDYNQKRELPYKTDIEKPLGSSEDYYEFDPLLALQEENKKDGVQWNHPEDYKLKNRMLFVVNNRTAKGKPVDVSHLEGGYGVYELPIDVSTTTMIKMGKRRIRVPNPTPEPDKMKMVYPLDPAAEYVEISLSADHRYLAIFSVKEGGTYVEIVDADTWQSGGPVEVFSPSEKMTYAWGDDGSMALTNHQGDIAVLYKTGKNHKPYELLYSGKTEEGFDKAFFESGTAEKKNSIAKYSFSIDWGLAVSVKDGKAALAQNLLVGSGMFAIRNAALSCAVIDESGVIYNGKLINNIVDLDDDLSDEDAEHLRNLLDGTAEDDADTKAIKYMIQPIPNENRAQWD